MTLPRYTLVYRPGQSAGRQQLRDVLKKARGDVATPSATLESMGAEVREAMVSGAIQRVLAEMGDGPARRQPPRAETVGIWDLAAQVGELPEVIETWNRIQTVFAFLEVQAGVPSGLISRPERVVAWAREKHKRVPKGALADLVHNLIYEDFAVRARPIRAHFGLDHLIGVAPAMVAFEDGGDLYWNYFSMSEKGLVLVASYDLARLARKAGRPFAVAVAEIALSTLLVQIHDAAAPNGSETLEFHDEITGCLFDFNEDRDTIVKSLRRLLIEPACQQKIRPKYRAASLAMVAALRDLGADRAAVASPSRRAGAGRRKGATSGRRPHLVAAAYSRKRPFKLK